MIPRRRTITLNGDRFGAILDHSAGGTEFEFDLTIILRVYFRPNGDMTILPTTGECQLYSNRSPSPHELLLERVVGQRADADGNVFMLEDWPPSAWREFCEGYQNGATQFWTNRFLLESNYNIMGPRREFTGSSEGASTMSIPIDRIDRTNRVKCKFHLELTSNMAHAHTIINAYYLSPLNNRRFRSDSTHYSSMDLELRAGEIVHEIPALNGIQLKHLTYLHEVGHSIGLNHVLAANGDFRCIIYQNAQRCYGETPETYSNIMGGGNIISWHEALPWRTALGELTNTSPNSWSVEVLTTPTVIAGPAVFE